MALGGVLLTEDIAAEIVATDALVRNDWRGWPGAAATYDMFGKRHASPIRQDVALNAGFRAIRGLGPVRSPFGAFTMALVSGAVIAWRGNAL